ncbi:MAG: FtsX-like permease family protein, partial [Oscillospiraceae bacterium]|nr:FtsX-like permease family protein [Oscillospiraceae bacterium]
ELIKGARQLNNGWDKLYEAKADGQKELDDAKKELNEGYAELKDAEKDLAEGWEEYYEGLAEFEEAKADAETEIADAKIEIADAEKELADLKEPKWYVFDRDDNPGYSSYESDVAIIDSVGKVFPIFFFLVAMLVCLTTMTRMVEEQRTQIGTMKALGYDKRAILTKYIVYSAFASISGAVFGIALCAIVFPIIIYSAYAMRYVIPALELQAMPGTWLLVLAVCVLCTSLAVILAGYSELRENPAELMRPKAPKAGKRVLLERIPFIWKRLSFTRKVTVRNLFRYKKRIFMTVLGIAGCAALTLTGFGLLSSISGIFEKQYEEIFSYDLIVSLDSDSDEENIGKVMEELELNELSEKNLPIHIMSASYEGLKNLSLPFEPKLNFTKNGTTEKTSLTYPEHLTDGNLATESESYASRFAAFENGSAQYYLNGSRYFDAFYDLKSEAKLKYIVIANTPNVELANAKYNVYLSDDKEDLYSDDNLYTEVDNVKTLENGEGVTVNVICFDKDLSGEKDTGRYVGIRVFSPACNPGVGAAEVTEKQNNLYVRLREFSVYGDYTDPNFVYVPKDYIDTKGYEGLDRIEEKYGKNILSV